MRLLDPGSGNDVGAADLGRRWSQKGKLARDLVAVGWENLSLGSGRGASPAPPATARPATAPPATARPATGLTRQGGAQYRLGGPSLAGVLARRRVGGRRGQRDAGAAR